MPEQKSLLAWHYTTGEKCEQIIASGVLIPATANITKREIPILWFSMAQFWEPTASKGMLIGNQLVNLKMKGTYEHCRGLVRFGVSPSSLIPWPALGRVARIPAKMRVSIEQVARAEGSDPRAWCGIPGGFLPVDQVEAIDVFDGTRWVRIRPKGTPELEAYEASLAA